MLFDVHPLEDGVYCVTRERDPHTHYRVEPCAPVATPLHLRLCPVSRPGRRRIGHVQAPTECRVLSPGVVMNGQRQLETLTGLIERVNSQRNGLRLQGATEWRNVPRLRPLEALSARPACQRLGRAHHRPWTVDRSTRDPRRRPGPPAARAAAIGVGPARPFRS
jgi:hypothetical protein